MQCSIFFSNLFLVEPSNIEVSEQAASCTRCYLRTSQCLGGVRRPEPAGTTLSRQGEGRALEGDDDGEEVAPGLGTRQQLCSRASRGCRVKDKRPSSREAAATSPLEPGSFAET